MPEHSLNRMAITIKYPGSATQEVKDTVDSVSLPSESEDPTFKQFKTSEKAIIASYQERLEWWAYRKFDDEFMELERIKKKKVQKNRPKYGLGSIYNICPNSGDKSLI